MDKSIWTDYQNKYPYYTIIYVRIFFGYSFKTILNPIPKTTREQRKKGAHLGLPLTWKTLLLPLLLVKLVQFDRIVFRGFCFGLFNHRSNKWTRWFSWQFRSRWQDLTHFTFHSDIHKCRCFGRNSNSNDIFDNYLKKKRFI